VHKAKAATELERLLEMLLVALDILEATEAATELANDELDGATEEIAGVELAGVVEEPPPPPPQDSKEKDTANKATRLRNSIVISLVNTLKLGIRSPQFIMIDPNL
jgi:hypothetical protein